MNTVALSPYHLTTREVPAMAALLLAGRVCTFLPVPVEGETREAVVGAFNHAPRYRRLLNNWLLLAPLFNAGVITTLSGGDDPGTSARAAASRLNDEGRWNKLRPFSRQGLFTDTEQYLDAVSADLLKGGPDPGIALPVWAGLDAFAAEHGIPVFRAGHAAAAAGGSPGSGGRASESGGSLAQQVESRLGEPLFSVGVPILKQAGARAVLAARAALGSQLRTLRDAFDAAMLNPSASTGLAARRAGADYAKAFKHALGDKLNRDDEGGRRLVPGFVSITARRLPVDAALISSLAAINRASGGTAVVATATQSRAGSVSSVTGPLITLTVTPLDVEPL